MLKGLINRISPALQADNFEAPQDLGKLSRRARMSLEGQIGIVTGGSRGIGRAIVLALAA